MKIINKQITNQRKQWLVLVAILAGFSGLAPIAHAGNVGWNISVGGGYGGGWRPAAYGPGYGGGWGQNWRGGGYYGGGYTYPYGAAYYSPPAVYMPPVLAYSPPPPPMVLAAQAQPPVWYFCEANGKYFPYVQSCPSGWVIQAAMPPSSGISLKEHSR